MTPRKNVKDTAPRKVGKKRGHPHKVDWLPEEDGPGFRGLPFHNALDDLEHERSIMPMITLRELTMLRFLNNITDKPEWTEKVLDENEVSEWKKDATRATDNPEEEMTSRMFDYCIAELRDRAKKYNNAPNGAVKVFDGDVYKSDTAVSEKTKLALRKAVRLLEEVPEHVKDWRPESGRKILDLVSPSLFPVIFGKTRILSVGANATTLEDCINRSGEGTVLNGPKSLPEFEDPELQGQKHPYSNTFQWLPCEVDISGEKPRIMTYINNLHPRDHQEIYRVIEDVINSALPLWGLTLAPQGDKDEEEDEEEEEDEGDDEDEVDGLRPRPKFARRINYKVAEYKRHPDHYTAEEAAIEYDQDDNWDEDWRNVNNGEEVDDYVLTTKWRESRRIVVQPDALEEYKPLKQRAPIDLKSKYGSLPLQIIVKLVNIELTPENPEYEGRNWHVEGKMNERICASALYYYSSDNITHSSVSFRHYCSSSYIHKVEYFQDHHEWVTTVFGIRSGKSCAQDVGSIETREGRLITYPSPVHYKVEPFKLKDPKKPGHRKLLALFLVDPNVSVISTADVPCQRRDWWGKEVMNTSGSSLKKLPTELKDNVVKQVDFPLSMDVGKTHRLEMEEERKAFSEASQEAFDKMELTELDEPFLIY